MCREIRSNYFTKTAIYPVVVIGFSLDCHRFDPYLYISPSIRNERKAAQKRFNEIQHELASVTGDQLVFESNPTGNVIDGDGEKTSIRIGFTRRSGKIFQAREVSLLTISASGWQIMNRLQVPCRSYS